MSQYDDATRPNPYSPPAMPGQPASMPWQVDASPAPPPPPLPPPPRRRGARMTRRRLLVSAGALGIGAAALTSGIIYARDNGGLVNPFQHVTPAQNAQISWLLRRVGFGGTASEIQDYAALGYSGAVERLLAFATPDDLDARLSALNLDLSKIADQQRWWALRMIYSKNPLQEKMTLFWHGLLTSSFTKVGGMAGYAYMINQNQYLRAHALDTYDNLLLGITSDPAMMWWLDLRLSRKNAPNENYARELMELFTLGVNGGYTQTDVHEAARALTGWTLSHTGQAVYVANQHDTGSKTLLGTTGNLDYHDVIRIVAAHPATGPFLAGRIFKFFVHDNPSAADLQPLTSAYYSSGHSIKAVMRALFTSPAFLSSQSYRARLKSPTEFVVGAVRQLELPTDGQNIAPAIATLGQILLDPPNVAGWPGDGDSTQWLNTGTWVNRVNIINAVVAGGAARGGAATQAQQLQTTITANKLQSLADITNHYVNTLLDGTFSAGMATITSYLATIPAGGATLKLANGQPIAATIVHSLLYFLMSSPDYQLN